MMTKIVELNAADYRCMLDHEKAHGQDRSDFLGDPEQVVAPAGMEVKALAVYNRGLLIPGERHCTNY